MKHLKCKPFTFLMAFLLILPFLSLSNARVANAKPQKETYAKPVLSETMKTLEGNGKSFELKLKNLKGRFYNAYWYTMDDKIVKVKKKGGDSAVITSIKEGTTYIKVRVSYWNQSYDTLSCKIIVKPESVLPNVYEEQAKLISLERDDQNRLLAVFDKPIQTPGLVLVNNKRECIEGTKSTWDERQIYYTMSADAAKLQGSQSVYIGYWEGYNVTPSDTTSDRFKEIKVDFTKRGERALPAPYGIEQEDKEPSVIYIHFADRLDESSAQNLMNYSIKDVAIKEARLINPGGSSVKLTLQAGSVKKAGNYNITVSGVKGYNNTFTAINPYQKTLYLKENVPPVLTSFYYSYPTSVVLIFNEAITGTPDFKIIQGRENILSYVSLQENQVILYLTKTPKAGESLQIIPTENNSIKDLSGNSTVSILNRSLVP